MQGTATKFFGVSLSEVMSRPKEKTIPSLVKKMILHLNSHTSNDELFKTQKYGSVEEWQQNDKVKQLIDQCDTNPDVSFTSYDPLLVAHILKVYFYTLPEPLIPTYFFHSLIQTNQIPDRESQIQSIIQSLDSPKFPLRNFVLLNILCLFFSKFQNSSFLSLTFSPLLLRSPTSNSSSENSSSSSSTSSTSTSSATSTTTTTSLSAEESFQYISQMNWVVKIFIDFCDSIFPPSKKSKSKRSNPSLKSPPTESKSTDPTSDTNSASNSNPNPSSELNSKQLAEQKQLEEMKLVVDTAITTVMNKLAAYNLELEATNNIDEIIVIARKIRTAKRLLFLPIGTSSPPSLLGLNTKGSGALDNSNSLTNAGSNSSSSNPHSTSNGASGNNNGVLSTPYLTGKQMRSHMRRSIMIAKLAHEKSIVSCESGSFSDIGVRKSQEDTLVSKDSWLQDIQLHDPQNNNQSSTEAGIKYSYYAVFDGHGGPEVSDILSKQLDSEIVRRGFFKEENKDKVLYDSFLSMDKHILEHESSKTSSSKSGSTAVVAIICNRDLWVVNTGDSELILGKRSNSNSSGSNNSSHGSNNNGVGWKGEILSTKHKPTNGEEKERITAMGGHVVFGRLFGDLAVSRAFGDGYYKRPISECDFVTVNPSVRRVRLDHLEDDFVVLACDGVWDKLGVQECVDIVGAGRDEGKTAGECSKMVVDRALEKGTKDNVTCIVVFFNWVNLKS